MSYQLDFDAYARNNDPETSFAAAKIPKGTQRYKVLLAYRDRELIDEEAGKISSVASAWKRCSELRGLGLIEPTGTVRMSSMNAKQRVCRITDAGKTALANMDV